MKDCEGQLFAHQLLHPLELAAIQHLIYAGWDVDRIFRVCIQGFNNVLNAPTASGPSLGECPQFDDFMKISQLLRFFQSMGSLQIGIKTEKLNEDGGNKYTLQLCFPSGYDQSEELIKMLGNGVKAKDFYIYDIPFGFDKEAGMGVMTRSLIGCMYYLSVGVDIPQAHKIANCVWMPKKGEVVSDSNWDNLVKGLLSVKYSKIKPREAYVTIQHKGYWFYIDDADIESKRTFVLLLQLYNLQSTTVKQDAPILTLPLG